MKGVRQQTGLPNLFVQEMGNLGQIYLVIPAYKSQCATDPLTGRRKQSLLSIVSRSSFPLRYKILKAEQ